MKFSRILLILFLILAASAAPASAQAPADLIKRRQADLLYPIGTLVQSTKNQGEKTFIIGVLGDAVFAGRDAAGNVVNHLDAAARASNARTGAAKRRKVIILRFKAVKDYERCHLLVVSDGHQMPAKQLADNQKGESPVLLVGTEAGRANAGIPINFYEVQDADGAISVRLEFAPKAARSTGFDQINPSLPRLLYRGLGRVVETP